MSAYAERRKGKLTGKWIGECLLSGDRFRKRFDSKKEAERWADFIKVTGALPPEESAAAGMTFAAAVAEMKATNEAGRDPSAGARLEHVTAIIGPLTPLTSIATTTLDRIVTDLKKRPGKKPGSRIGAGTINRYLSAASSVLTFAKARGHITDAPVVPWQKEGGKRFCWLTEEQEARMAAEMDEACALTLGVLVASGVRWGEFESLEAAQVDIRKDHAWVRLWKTKTNSPRSVPIPVDMGRQLRAAIEAKTLPTYYTFRASLKAALKSAGQSPDFCVHSLRHTTATRLIQRGVGLPIVMKYLGHKAIQTTLRYTQVADEDLEIASAKLSQRAGQSPVSLAHVLEEV